VDRLAARRCHAALSVSKHAAVGRHGIGGVAHAEHSLNPTVASSENPADFVGIALSSVGD
jgi:hypothetical protein